MNKNVSMVKMLLLVSLVVSTVFANIITGRQLSILGITMTGGTFIFPLVYVVSDIVQEVYGYRWSRISAYIGFAFNTIISVLSMLLVMMPYPDHFVDASAYEVVLGNTPRFLIASLAAYFLGDLVNDVIFAKMKEKQGKQGFKSRAIASSVGGQFVDGIIFNVIAFVGVMPTVHLIISVPAGIVFSLLVEIVLVPFTEKLVHKTRDYEEKIALEESEVLA